MLPINIKINKSKDSQPGAESPSSNVLNLNNQPSNPLKNPLKKYLYLLIVLLAIEALAIAALYFKQPDSPYLKLFPKNLMAISYFNHPQISNLFKSLNNQEGGLSVFNWTEKEFRDLLGKAKIESPETILSLFQDQAALILLSGDKQPSGWMIFASIKVNSNQFNEAKDKAERTIKQNFNITDEDYRQIKITKIQNLDQNPNSLYYAKVNDYFIATNNLSRLKESIDLAVTNR